MWIYLTTIVHVFVCAVLIVVVLLQHGKSGMGSQTAFGPRGTATVLSRFTTVCAVIFMLTSILLTILSGRTRSSGGSVMDNVTTPTQSTPAPVKK